MHHVPKEHFNLHLPYISVTSQQVESFSRALFSNGDFTCLNEVIFLFVA